MLPQSFFHHLKVCTTQIREKSSKGIYLFYVRLLPALTFLTPANNHPTPSQLMTLPLLPLLALPPTHASPTPPTPQLMEEWLNSTNYNRTEEYLTTTGQTMIVSWIVSIYCIGGMIGGAATGLFSERWVKIGLISVSD